MQRLRRIALVLAMLLVANPSVAETEGQQLQTGIYRLMLQPAPSMGYWLRLYEGQRLLHQLDPDACIHGELKHQQQNRPMPGCVTLEGQCHSGGAHCCSSILLFHLCENRPFVTEISAGHSDGLTWIDANQDGTLEIELVDWGFAYYSPGTDENAPSLPFAFSPGLYRLGVWAGDHWRPDHIGEFPGYYESLLAKSRLKDTSNPESAVSDAIQKAYFTLMAGRGNAATKTLLQKKLPPDWLKYQDRIQEDIRSSAKSSRSSEKGFNPFTPVPIHR
jgi:hypothetical protein